MNAHAAEITKPDQTLSRGTLHQVGGSRQRFGKGDFTMIELLGEILIVALLSASLMSAVAAYRGRAYSARCTSNLRYLGVAMASWLADTGAFPSSCSDVNGDGVSDSTHNWMKLGPGNLNGPNLFRSVYPDSPFEFFSSQKM